MARNSPIRAVIEGAKPSHTPESEERRILASRCAEFPPNDTGNGKRLLAHFGDDVRYVRDVGWHVWNGKHFQREGGNELVTRFGQETAARIEWEAGALEATPSELSRIEAAREARDKSSIEQSAAEKELIKDAREAEAALAKRRSSRRKFSISCGNTSRISGMITQALPHCCVAPNELDADPMLLNVLNGTLELRRLSDRDATPLRPHRREDMLSRLAQVTYDPEAECPRWTAFITRFIPNPEIRKFLQIYYGLALTGLTGEQVLVFNYGTGGNGKSVFIEAIARLLGNYAVILPFESLAGENNRRGDQATPDIARLPGARLVRAAEPEQGVQFKESLLKSLTGGEPMLARNLHEGFFQFQPVFKLSLSGNHKPRISGTDHGIWRRVLLVPWTVTVEKQERRLFEDVVAEFDQERAGILNWLIDGLLFYMVEGLKPPQEVLAATEAYREEMDPVVPFIADCVERTPPGPEAPSITAREMYEAFKAWAAANAVRVISEKRFAAALAEKGFPKSKERVRRYLEVRVNPVSPPFPP